MLDVKHQVMDCGMLPGWGIPHLIDVCPPGLCYMIVIVMLLQL